MQIAHIKYNLLTSKKTVSGRPDRHFGPALGIVVASGCFAATAAEMLTSVTFVATAGKVS